MHPVLLIPGLFPEISDDKVPRLPHLELALARGSLVFSPGDALLEEWSGVADAPSFAARVAIEAGLASEASHWLCADPIHLQVEGDALLLLECYSFSLLREEADALLTSLNQHFEDRGLKFFALTPERWLIGMNLPARIQTTHPLRRVGRNIDGYLPQGEAARMWRTVFNEVQMLFHEHPTNQQRALRQERAISGVWFWDCPSGPHEARVIDTLRRPSAYGDAEAWRAEALALDEAVVGPLLRQLREGAIDGFSLAAVEGRCAATLTLSRWQLWRFWRRVRPLVRVSGVPQQESA